MNTAKAPRASAFDSPSAAIGGLTSLTTPVGTQTVPLVEAVRRVLAEPLRSDRPSPPCDVSAMDGYAVRLAELACSRLPVVGEVSVGQPPLPMTFYAWMSAD